MSVFDDVSRLPPLAIWECFAPRRDDWDDAPRGQPVAPRWP